MKKLTIEFRIVSGFSIALLLLLLAGGLMYHSLQEYIVTSRWIAHTYQVLDALSDVRSGVREMVSSQRTYLITGDDLYRESHEREANLVRSALAGVVRLTVDNPRQQLRAAALALLVEERLQQLDKTAAVYSTLGFAAARDLVRSGPSRTAMDALLKQITVMEEEERALLKQRSDQAERDAGQARTFGVILGAVALTGLILLWWRVRREERERQITEIVVHESRLLKQIIDLLPVGVFVAGATGTLTQINPAARKIWNGERIVDIEQYGVYAGWWPDTGKRLAADEWALARTLKTGEIIRDEMVDICCFDGTRKTIASSAMPIRDRAGHIISCLAVQMDVTGFKRTERQLRTAARFDETQGRAVALFSTGFDRRKILNGLLALLAELHPLPASALYEFDNASGRFTCEAAHGLSGAMPREFALGEGLLGQAAQAEKTMLLTCTELTLQTGLADFEPVEVLMLPISYQGRRLAVLVLAASAALDDGDRAFLEQLAVTLGVTLDNLRQYSDLKQLAEQLRASSEEIALKNQQLEEASRMKSEFLANMSHELRTPLNSVIGFSEVLQDRMFGPINEKQQEYVANILTSGRHLLSLINDILDLSKIESGRMELDPSTFSLRESLDASLIMLREKALKGAIELRLDIAPEADVLIEADQRKLKQIMFNLISNAVKFTPAGGTVDVTAVRDDGFIEIRVADTGMGIKGEDIPKLFQTFTQLESVYTKGFEGTGLGLALTRQLVELHGGRIWVESLFGTGSRFSFTLPLTPAVAKEPAANRPDAVPGSAPPVNGNVVLLIEDDPLTLTSLHIALQSKGYRTLRANNGEEGVRMARNDSPDLIVLDLMMPGMNGFNVADRLRNENAASNIPVLVLTAMNLSTADRARLSGKVWRIAEKGSLSTQNFISLVERAIGSKIHPPITGDSSHAIHDTDR